MFLHMWIMYSKICAQFLCFCLHGMVFSHTICFRNVNFRLALLGWVCVCTLLSLLWYVGIG